MGPRCAAVLLKAQGGMLCPPWVETGPFEPCGLYRLIVQLWPRPSPVMSQHSRERINELVLGQMSSIMNVAGNSGSKSTRIAVHQCKPTLRHSPQHLHAKVHSVGAIWIPFQLWWALDRVHFQRMEKVPQCFFLSMGFSSRVCGYRWWLNGQAFIKATAALVFAQELKWQLSQFSDQASVYHTCFVSEQERGPSGNTVTLILLQQSPLLPLKCWVQDVLLIHFY